MTGMIKRATERPEGFRKPAHWDNSPPPPRQSDTPAGAKPGATNEDPDGLSPTRYGDWVHKGIAVDF